MQNGTKIAKMVYLYEKNHSGVGLKKNKKKQGGAHGHDQSEEDIAQQDI